MYDNNLFQIVVSNQYKWMHIFGKDVQEHQKSLVPLVRCVKYMLFLDTLFIIFLLNSHENGEWFEQGEVNELKHTDEKTKFSK